MNLDTDCTHCTKINSEAILARNVTHSAIKLPEGIIAENPSDAIGDEFLDTIPET